jgi:hypothetical protein
MANVDGLRFYSSEELAEKIAVVMRQTSYTEEDARDKLICANLDYVKVIREFHGIKEVKDNLPIKSIQQVIYKEIRHKMNNSIRDFNRRHDDKLVTELGHKE